MSDQFQPPASGGADLPSAQPLSMAKEQPPAYSAAAPVLPQQPMPQGPVPVATGLAMKRRNPVGVWLGLPLITLGIYSLVWYYKIHREMAEFDRRRHVPVAGPLMVLIFLSWTIIAPYVSYFNTGKRIQDAQRSAGIAPSCSAGLGLLLMFVFGLGTLYYQSQLNKIVDRYPGAAPRMQVPLFG